MDNRTIVIDAVNYISLIHEPIMSLKYLRWLEVNIERALQGTIISPNIVLCVDYCSRYVRVGIFFGRTLIAMPVIVKWVIQTDKCVLMRVTFMRDSVMICVF